MNTIRISELPAAAKARICWGFLWRGLVVTIGSTIAGGLLGGIAGFTLGLMGLGNTTNILGGILGAICGFFFLYLYVRWLLASRIGNFRLLLVRADE